MIKYRLDGGFLSDEERASKVKIFLSGRKLQKILLFLSFLCITVFVSHYDSYVNNYYRVHEEYYVVFLILVIPVVFFPKIVWTAFNLSIVLMLLFNIYHYFDNDFPRITTGILALLLIPAFAASTFSLYINNINRKAYKEAEDSMEEGGREYYLNHSASEKMDDALEMLSRKWTWFGILGSFFFYWFCYSFLTDWLVFLSKFFS